MQCQRCQFENMPDRHRCFKCGSILSGEALVLDVHPPRMATWQGPLRRLTRVFRRRVTLDGRAPLVDPIGWYERYGSALGGILLSVVPGLTHLILGQFRAVWWAWLIWLFFLLSAVYMYWSTWGWACMGIAAAFHGWMALDAGILDRLENAFERILSVIGVFVFVVVCYIALAWSVGPSDRFVRIPFAIEAANIRAGDTLIVDDLTDESELLSLSRGSIIRFRAVGVGTSGSDLAVGQIIALPGEVVTIRNGLFGIDGHLLPEQRYPVPNWLSRRTYQVSVGPEQYFVSSEYSRRGNAKLGRNAIGSVCLIEHKRVTGVASMVWWPLARRHSLEDAEAWIDSPN